MKYCDLVMKGGITSGIVYPNVVVALAREYRFKNIGGTSAGAIAAAASAAAAYGDRLKSAGERLPHDPARVGFEGLEQVADQLSREGFIHGLFQPARGARTAYRMISTFAGNKGPFQKLMMQVVAIPAIAPIEMIALTALFLLAGYLVGGFAGLAGAVPSGLVCAYLGAGIAALLRVARVARRNHLGLCSGMSGPGRAGNTKAALTEWLHDAIQTLAAKASGQPLTFADLWAAPRYDSEPNSARALNLQMITTSVLHREPRTLPFDKGQFWFCATEFGELFPKDVVDWMIARGGEQVTVQGRTFHRLPVGGDLPVVVAMRMSLSFPLLISAIPLYEEAGWATNNETNPPASGISKGGTNLSHSILEETDALTSGGRVSEERITAMRICWFSDGGISSNFPIHLFDQPIPAWPTFAVNLVYPEAGSEPSTGNDVWLPARNNAGWQPTYHTIASQMALAELSKFLFGVIGTMQNWRDLLLSRAPGQRDRIVHIALASDEGGMNLNMPQDVLDRISGKGSRAGEILTTFSFDNHLWIRFRNVVSACQRFTIDIAAVGDQSRLVPEFASAYATVRKGQPRPKSYQFGSREREAKARELFDILVLQGEEWKDLGPDFTINAPRPLPQLRIVPTF